MNKFDRIFIGILTVIICISWIYAVKNFNKGREAINVVGEGKIELPPNKISMRINAAIAGDRTSSQEKRNADLKEFEKTFAELGFTISAKEKSFKAKEPESGYQPHCYLQGEPTEAPCLDGYLIINSSGDSIIENGQKLIDLFADKSNRKISHTELSLLNADEALKQARLLALKDGKLMAKRIAKELWVDLGRLLQSTEYGLAEDTYYGDAQQNYVFIQSFDWSQNIHEAKNITIIRKAYLTYDID